MASQKKNTDNNGMSRVSPEDIDNLILTKPFHLIRLFIRFHFEELEGA